MEVSLSELKALEWRTMLIWKSSPPLLPHHSPLPGIVKCMGRSMHGRLAGGVCSIRGMVPCTISWVGGCAGHSCALSCWASWEGLGIASIYLGGHSPAIKCIVHCDLFLVCNIVPVYNAME